MSAYQTALGTLYCFQVYLLPLPGHRQWVLRNTVSYSCWSVVCSSNSGPQTPIPQPPKGDKHTGSKVLQKEQFAESVLDLGLGSSITDKETCEKSFKIAKVISPFVKWGSWTRSAVFKLCSEFPGSYVRVPYQWACWEDLKWGHSHFFNPISNPFIYSYTVAEHKSSSVKRALLVKRWKTMRSHCLQCFFIHSLTC